MILRRPARRGNAVLEFALGAALLVPVFAGVTQYGLILLTYNNLESAVRNGARFAAMQPYSSTTSRPSTDYANSVRNVVVYNNPSPARSARPLVAGLMPGHVELEVTMNGRVPARVEVRIRNFTLSGIFMKIRLNGNPSAAFPYNG
jgi:hypothetical protein